jgi:ATP-dependent DNA ligase
MLCLAVPKIPQGPEWEYELKLDGSRAIGVRTAHTAQLWSRNEKEDPPMYYQVISQCTQNLKNLESWLDKAEVCRAPRSSMSAS